MKTKFSSIFTLILVLVAQLTFAQEQTITGTVTDTDGLPLPGVNVLIKDTSSGTQTDFDGNYSIAANQGDVLVFSFVGMETAEYTVANNTTIDVTMSADAAQLDEVVVTALGIKREKKSLGYSVQEVGGEEVSTAKDQSFISSLSGKVSGLQIKKSNSLGGSVNAVLRGSNSFTGNNQALFVVDGVPISNANQNRSGQGSNGGGFDYGNAASDINPEDIESISVLKGATAAALYGSDAANGVILITTKKGSKSKGIGVTINNSTTFSTIDKETFPEYQDEYGAGYGPYYGSTGDFYDVDVNGDGQDDFLIPVGEDASFGGRFDPSVMVYDWSGIYPQLDSYQQARPWTAAENGPETLFRTGISNYTNISLDGGNEDGTFRFGYTNDDRQGIIPNSLIKKDIVDLSGTYNFTDKLSATAKGTYTRVSGRGRYGTGYDSGNVVQMMRQWFQTNVDLQEQKDAYFATGQNITWNPNGLDDLTPHYFDNPYFTLYENYQSDLRNRFIGRAQLDYQFNDWLSAFARFGVDTYSDLQEERKNIGSVDQPFYSKYQNQFEQYNYDFIVNFDKDISETINLNGLVGTSLLTQQTNRTLSVTNGGLVVPGLWALSNSASALSPPSEFDFKRRKLGHYAQLSIGFNNLLFLDGSFRVDESSTLPAGENVYTYPAGSASFVFSELLNNDWLDFAKLRAGWAKVTNDAGAYSVNNTVSAGDPFGSTPIYFISDTSQNPDLKPESTEEAEIGLEAQLFNRRLGLDISAYKKNTTDQILPVQVSPASGFNFKYVNAGEMENKGIELALYGSPIKSDDFEWNINVNWAKNENTVVSLFEDGENLLLFSNWSTAVNARKGEPYGTITGTNYVFDEATGQRVVGSDGKYLRTASTTEIIGNIQPDWTGGVNNTFRYKGLSFGFLIDVQQGGDLVNYDMAFGGATGLLAETAGLNELGNPKRDPVSEGGGVLLDGVTEDGQPNTTRADASTYLTPFGYYGGSADTGVYAPDASLVYDASYVKLREVRLGYDLPQNLVEQFSLTSANIGVTGRNLWIIHKNLPYGDPEASPSSGNLQGIQNGTLPSTRDVSLNVTVKF
ncbi:SusC/RagA family TonB-linked outer membrane protein [Gramella sp. KN1008]|uniref:SusC/RagA family TonB-linked outer membrane protein n=1 Tax=Gramella sp. KN1008 TaxID=2529298 RepID=UPI001038B0DE|nr:SusC/RagA family TonB-linked outer membrane protein [Gramella sp. KN1008]TBW27429.1 SusC/RagA family TonB-linked outer membrane protein [Gramella sp. KN1008]